MQTAELEPSATSEPAKSSPLGREATPQEPPLHPVLDLQRRLGNRSVRRWIEAQVLPRPLGRSLVLRKPGPPPSPGVTFYFSVPVSSVLPSDQLLLQFVQHYRHLPSAEAAAAARDKEGWAWSGEPPVVTEQNVKQGYILIKVLDRSLVPASPEEQKARSQYFQGLSPDQQAELNAETDRQFWQKTGYRPGQKLGGSADDRSMAEYWKVLRGDLVRQRQAIEALPPVIQEILFHQGADRTVEAQDYPTVLALAAKLAALTPAELAEYKSRVTAVTTSWSELEASVDRFRAEREERRKAGEEREALRTRLYGLKELYKQYQAYRSQLSINASLAAGQTPMGVGTALGSQPALNQMRTDLEAALKQAGFPSIEAFAQLIRDYQGAFEHETLGIAKVMLDQYEHTLFEQERRYQDPAQVAALGASLGKTQAKARYEEGDRIRDEYFQGGGSVIVLTPGEAAAESEAVARRNEARKQGDAEVRSAAREHPLLANSDFDRERLARAPQGDVQGLMLDYIRARRKDIADTRQNLKATPDLIYQLDELMKASYQSQNIQPGEIYDLVIQDRKSQVQSDRAIPQVVLAVIAVAAGFFTAGGGTVAVLAAGTAFGISAYQAVEEFRRYETLSAARGAQLLSEDPSFAWVVVALVGAGLDLAVVASTLRAVRPAVEAFNQGTDLAKLQEALAGLKVDESVQKTILQAAKGEAETRAAWKSIFRPTPGIMRMAIVPFGEEFGKLVYAVYLAFKRGLREFQLFLKSREAVELIGDAAKLAPEELASLKAAYLQAIEEYQRIAQHGVAIGFSDAEVNAFMRLRSETKGMSADQVVQEMDAWLATKKSGIPFGFKDAEQLQQFKATAEKELSRLLKRSDPNAEAFLQGSSLSGISYKRQVPFDPKSDFDVAISSRYLFKQAEKLGYEVSLSPKRIGPLSDEQIRELGLNKLRDRLSSVVSESQEAEAATQPTRDINFMLFENPEAVTKPIGANSTETSRAALPLKPR